MSPDRQLLVACCRAHWRPRQVEHPVSRDVDWARFLQRAERLGVAALLRSTLTKFVDRARVPPEVLRRVDRLYYQQAARNAGLGASLQEVLAVFSRYEVPVIVLKGASLAELVYGNIALRPMVDVDLLVQRKHLDRAESLVRELGYLPDASSHSVDWYRRHHHHLAPYRSRDGAALLELHHHIFPPAAGVPVPMQDLWYRARPGDLSAGQALVLAPADLLLHLSVGLSAVEHFLGGLKTLCDIAAVIQRYEKELDWAGLLQSARMYALERHLYYGLWLAQSLVEADVPRPIMKELEHSPRGLWVQDVVVRSLIRGAVLRYDGEVCALPAGLVFRLAAELLAAKARRAKVAGLLRWACLGLKRHLGHMELKHRDAAQPVGTRIAVGSLRGFPRPDQQWSSTSD